MKERKEQNQSKEPKIKEKKWRKELEKSLLEKWEKEKQYKFVPSGKILTLDTPPPYPRPF